MPSRYEQPGWSPVGRYGDYARANATAPNAAARTHGERARRPASWGRATRVGLRARELRLLTCCGTAAIIVATRGVATISRDGAAACPPAPPSYVHDPCTARSSARL